MSRELADFVKRYPDVLFLLLPLALLALMVFSPIEADRHFSCYRFYDFPAMTNGIVEGGAPVGKVTVEQEAPLRC
jgi:hypothetical protein